jgi:hypothetical protein
MDNSNTYIDTSANHGSRIYQSSEGLPDKPSTITSAWLETIPFQLFITIRPVYHKQVESIVKQFLNQAEKYHKSVLSCCISYESNPIPNVHICVACHVQLDVKWIEDYLKEQPVSFNIQTFGVNALPYTLKTLNSAESNIDYHGLDLYLKTPLNHQERRRIERHQKRLNQTKR